MTGMAREAAGQGYLPPCPLPPATYWSAYYPSHHDPITKVAWIDAGDVVYLDVPTPDLAHLRIDGTLVFDH